MPSLEIVCLNQLEPSDFSSLPFRVEAKNKLVSNRGPNPLFQSDFDGLKGCIYHLLDEGGVTAYHLLNRRDWWRDEGYNVVFNDEYAPLIKGMAVQLLLVSPIGQVLFTTDYQFGPDIERHGPIPFADFWQLHDSGGIRMNTSYLITRS